MKMKLFGQLIQLRAAHFQASLVQVNVFLLLTQCVQFMTGPAARAQLEQEKHERRSLDLYSNGEIKHEHFSCHFHYDFKICYCL